MAYTYKPYPLGKHSVDSMVPRFHLAKNCAAFCTEVAKKYPLLKTEYHMAISAYVWYHRSNHFVSKFAPYAHHTDNASFIATHLSNKAFYAATGVYPIDPQQLRIKPATLRKYGALLGLNL